MSQTAGTAAEQAMQTLTAQWYNAVTAGCRLDPATFQLAQGFPLLGTTSEALWQALDALPPRSLAHYWNPGQLASFAQAYGAVVSALSPPSQAAFVDAMGDYYEEWNRYKREASATEWANGILPLFKAWSEREMPSGQAMRAYKALAGMSGSPAMVAEEMWLQAGGITGRGVFAYSTTNEALQQQLESAAGPIAFEMNSATASSDVSHTWAKGSVGGLLAFFAGGASGSFDRSTSAIAEAGVEIDVRIGHLLTFTAGPLSQPQRGYLARYAPWYDSAALSLAFQSPQEELWRGQPPNWQQTFGPSGSLQNVTTSLVMASGMTTTITSATSFGADERTAIRAAAKFGFFPFFQASANGGWTHEVSFGDSGAMNVTSTIPGDKVVVLGAIVTPIARYLGGS